MATKLTVSHVFVILAFNNSYIVKLIMQLKVLVVSCASGRSRGGSRVTITFLLKLLDLPPCAIKHTMHSRVLPYMSGDTTNMHYLPPFCINATMDVSVIGYSCK